MSVLEKALRYKQYLNTAIYVELMHKYKKMPVFEICNDESTYTDFNSIHLGTKMLEDGTDKEVFDQMYFLLGHEMQHIQSSVEKDLKAAITISEREICNELAKKVLGKPIRLTKEDDFIHFYEELSKNGVFMNRGQIHQLIHFVLNALEDGRIELIRSVKHPGFKKYRKIYRGKRWEKNSIPDDAPSYSALEPGIKLQMILNEILTLSTMEIYSKGFLRRYGDTRLLKEVNQFIPNIRTAIFAKDCKSCMAEGNKTQRQTSSLPCFFLSSLR